MSNARILLADDHAVVRAGIRNALQDLDGVVVIGEVGSGPELFDALDTLDPDCVLIDVTMPQFEPISAIRHIRRDYPALKILVVSAYDDDIYVQGLLSAGVAGYHLKDQPLSDLRLAVQRVLEGKRWVSSRLLDKLLTPSPTAGLAATLTPRQRDILRLLQRGYDNYNIALEMGISVKTVENHLTRLYRQLQVQSRLEAVNFVRQHPEIMENDGGRPLPALERVEISGNERHVILLVDDNQRYRSQLRRMLGRIQPLATIYEAADTNSAVLIAQRAAPQLAFVDVVLADEDGIRCAQRLKASAPGARVILISAYPDREFHRLGLEAGASAFVDKKDLDSAVLQQIIADALP